MISVIICTYNRADKITECLESFRQLEFPVEPWELILVDNNSNDATKQVIDAFIASTAIQAQYLFESEQGLSAARNYGLRMARGDIIAFTDDDCIVDRRWLIELSDELQFHPSLDFIGGRVELYNKNDKPLSIRVSRERTPFTQPHHTFSLIPGCNMIFRKHVYETIGPFDSELGPGASKGAIADDADFIYRAFRAGFNLAYVPTILVYHDHGRRTEQQASSVRTGYIKGRAALYAKHIKNGDWGLLKYVYWELVHELKTLSHHLLRGESIFGELYYLRVFAAGFWIGLKNSFGSQPVTPRGGH